MESDAYILELSRPWAHGTEDKVEETNGGGESRRETKGSQKEGKVDF